VVAAPEGAKEQRAVSLLLAGSATGKEQSNSRLLLGTLLSSAQVLRDALGIGRSEAMESYEVIRRAVDAAGVKRVAGEMKVSSSLVYKWCEEPKARAAEEASGAANPLDRVASLWDCTKDPALMDWLCRRAGGTFVPDPFRSADVNAEYVERTQRLIKEFSELLNVVSQSMLDDGQVDAKEAEHIRAHWQKLKQHAESFVMACEQGQYKKQPCTTRGTKSTKDAADSARPS
jgi:hypothetical protein